MGRYAKMGIWLKLNFFTVLLFVVVAWSLLYKLDTQPMYLWDESRQANNALEMLESGNFGYSTYQNQPDFWNTKPHLLIAIQAIFFKLLGPGLLALRLPSALAGIAVVWIWFVFLKKHFTIQSAYIFVFILLTSNGFNTYHITRTGDYDGLLLLFFTLCLTTFYHLVFIDKSGTKIIAFYVYFTLAILTKSLAAMLWLPPLAAVFFIFVNDKKTSIWVLLKFAWIPIVAVLVYYGYREWITPGYLQAVWDNEIAVRYFAPNEGHVSEWYYYFDIIANKYFVWYWIGLPIAIFGVMFIPKPNRSKLGFFVVFTLLFIAVLSMSQTRIYWYLAPAIVCLAFILATGLDSILARVPLGVFRKATYLVVYTSIVFVGFINWNQFWNEKKDWVDAEQQVVFLKAEKTGKIMYSGYWLLTDYNPFETYYSKILAKKDIQLKLTEKYRFNAGDTVLVSHYDQIDSLHKVNNMTQIHAPNKEFPVWVFRVDGEKGNYRN